MCLSYFYEKGVVFVGEIRVKHIMTDEELAEVHRLNKKVMTSQTEEEVIRYRQEIKSIIENAKQRYYRNENLIN